LFDFIRSLPTTFACFAKSNNSFNCFVNSSFQIHWIAPAATFSILLLQWLAKTVAVVVPSPAKSFV
jgi:hypothetical protein